MIDVPAYTNDGSPAKQVTIDEALLGGEVRESLLRLAVNIYEKRRRIGSRGTRDRGMTRGSDRKLYRQKGTGNARVGNRRTPQRRGGGVAFLLRNPSFRTDMPRQAMRRACQSAMLARLLDGVVRVFDAPALSEPKTRVVVELLKKLGVQGSCLMVVGAADAGLWKSARNIPGMTVCRVQDLNAYVLLEPEHVLFSRAAMDAYLEGLTK